MHLTPNSCVMSLLKMLIRLRRTALLRVSRHSLLLRATADRLTLVELLNFDKNRCEIPLVASGAIERDLLFLR